MKKPKIISELNEFILRGNMIDLAVGVIVGGAFNNIVKALVDDVVMPFISIFTGKIDYSNYFIALDGNEYATLDAANAAGVSVIKYGSFISDVINFLIMAIIVFFMVKGINSLRRLGKTEEPKAPTTKKCPFCITDIDINATRCPHCTSVIPEEDEEKVDA